MGIWKFTNYTSAAGEAALSAQIHLSDMPCPTLDYPVQVRAEANQAAARLSGPLEELGRTLQVQSDLITGARLDPRKRHSVSVAMRRGEVDAVQLRPYQRRSLSADLPKISLIASCGVMEVNSDRTYIRRVTQLALAIAWACEGLGMEVNAALMEGHWKYYLSPKQPIRQAQLAYILTQPGRFTPLQRYAVTLSRDYFYETGFSGAYQADTEMQRVSAKLQGRKVCPWGGAFPGEDGGAGVNWARTHWPDSDIVIGIGKLTDIQDADIRLPNQFNLDSAVTEIIKQAEALIL